MKQILPFHLNQYILRKTNLISSKFLNQAQLYLLIFLPPALVTGPALPDIILSLISLIFLFQFFYFKLWGYFKDKFIIGFFLFYFFILVAGLFSFDPYLLLVKQSGIIFFFRYLFFIIAVWHLSQNQKTTIKLFSLSLIITVTIVTLDGYLQWVTGQNIFGWKTLKIPYARLTGLFDDEPIIGHFLATTAPLAFILGFYEFHKAKYFPYLAIIFLIFVEVLIFGSGERMAFLNITLFTLGVVVLARKFQKARVIGLIISLIIIVLIGFNATQTKKRIHQTFMEVSNTLLPFLPYSPHHETHYITSLKMFKDDPYTGQGPKSFRYLCDNTEFHYENSKYKSGCATHPHNFYIQILAEIGIFGFIVFVIFYFSIFRSLLTGIYKRWTKVISISYECFGFLSLLLFINFWPLIPHKDLFNNWSIILTILPLGFYLFFKYQKLE